MPGPVGTLEPGRVSFTSSGKKKPATHFYIQVTRAAPAKFKPPAFAMTVWFGNHFAELSGAHENTVYYPLVYFYVQSFTITPPPIHTHARARRFYISKNL